LGNVFDGPTVSGDDLTGWAIVGDDGDGRPATSSRTTTTSLNSESGEVNVRLGARSGDSDAPSLAALRQAVQSWIDSLRAHYKADKTLGKTLSQGSTVRVGRSTPPAQTKRGALVDALVTVTYFTRL
jgi:hypothetical protein